MCPTKSTSCIYRILLALHSLQGLPNFRSGAKLDDITLYIRDNYATDGDVVNQVQTALKHCIRLGYVRKSGRKYRLIVGTAKILDRHADINQRRSEVCRIQNIFSYGTNYTRHNQNNNEDSLKCNSVDETSPSSNVSHCNTSSNKNYTRHNQNNDECVIDSNEESFKCDSIDETSPLSTVSQCSTSSNENSTIEDKILNALSFSKYWDSNKCCCEEDCQQVLELCDKETHLKEKDAKSKRVIEKEEDLAD